MSDIHDPLADIRIASPCKADWSSMTGDDRQRFCQQCKLHVHDLSAMTRDEAAVLLEQVQKQRSKGESGRVCVRFHRRADGKVLTQDCPVGWRQQARRMWARAAALVGMLWGTAACSRSEPLMGTPAPEQGEAQAEEEAPVLMGRIRFNEEPLMGAVVAPEVVTSDEAARDEAARGDHKQR